MYEAYFGGAVYEKFPEKFSAWPRKKGSSHETYMPFPYIYPEV